MTQSQIRLVVRREERPWWLFGIVVRVVEEELVAPVGEEYGYADFLELAEDLRNAGCDVKVVGP